MKKPYLFGAWLPDLPPHAHDGLVIARNCYSSPNGYRPIGDFAALTSTLAGFSGGTAFVGSDGTASLLAGTSTDLYRYSSGAWSSVLGSLTAGRWRFTQFGDVAVCVNGDAPVAYNLTAGTAAALGGSPPDASLCATVRDFVVLAGDPADILTVTWSAFNSATGWTAGTNQSGFQPMLEGGEIMALAGGEYGLIFQRNRIVRMTYTADDTVFQFDSIADNVGCISKGSHAQAGRLNFFLSERGFMLCDGAGVKPIGDEQVDRTFFATYSRSDLVNMYAAIDPRNFLVIWSMPGNPGQLWIYNWVRERWTIAEVSLTGIFAGFTANTSLEGIDALYPSGIDSVPISLDSPIFAGGEPLFLVANASGVVGTLTGDSLQATFRMAFIEPAMGQYTAVFDSEPIGDALAGTLTIDARARLGDGEANVTSSEMVSSGNVPIMANGRYLQMTWQPSGDWSYAQGLWLEFEGGEGR